MSSNTATLRKRWACPGSSSKPAIQYVTHDHLNVVTQINHVLIQAFRDSLSAIKANLTASHLFLLTDSEGVLLDLEYSSDLEQEVLRSPIRKGMVFTAESCGTNAISETMDFNQATFLPPERHESPLFQQWHCYATPLSIGSGHAGYLDVSTIDAHMQGELIAITKLIPAQMQNCYENLAAQEGVGETGIEFTERQRTILKLIARGLTVKAIAVKLKIKECTVNHHKKVIFNKLGVQSSTEAVSLASRLSCL